ncbi:AP endonuclease 2 [Morchella snyderi]|nr:AP endonuclease 2 [Morchella snyderi]
MTLRITTWNVNGIRNPFSHQPWFGKTFQAMFDILEADIVCIQELKIQKKDLKDDMVLVPGWDCFCTFPKHKKGYSGVAIYTRQSKCNPMKAEEGITGILTPPGRDGMTYLSLPSSESIGGYPKLSPEKAALLDSEGRCLILDFGAFILIGLYCPANTDPARDDIRIAFAAAVDERVRNLIEIEKRRVIVVGDINITRDEIDDAAAKGIMMESNLDNYKDTPARQILHNLLKPHTNGVMVDLCREFFPQRRGMYTCWSVIANARPGNHGQRIDYVLCSSDMRTWFKEANIQEGLMGSDHCPVYGVINEKIIVGGREQYLLDIINPPGLFVDGKRQPHKTAPKLKLSAQASSEYTGRQNIREMFSKVAAQPSSSHHAKKALNAHPLPNTPGTSFPARSTQYDPAVSASLGTRRELSSSQKSLSLVGPSAKRQKIVPSGPPGKKPVNATPKKSHGQQSLVSFFKKQTSPEESPTTSSEPSSSRQSPKGRSASISSTNVDAEPRDIDSIQNSYIDEALTGRELIMLFQEEEGAFPLADPIESKEKWSQLFTRPAVPRCEAHNEPCIKLITKKPGPNVGRAFWMCSRPLGPGGSKFTSGQAGEWRCNFFKWSSDKSNV